MTKAPGDDSTPPTAGAPEPINSLYDDNAARAFANDRAASPLPAVPPEWVPLAELPGYVARRYGVASHVCGGDLVLDVRRRAALRHRIHISPDRITGRLPPGLDTTYAFPKRTVVVDWEAAETDWLKGEVLFCRLPDGTELRLSIDVLWEDVELYVSLRLRQWTLRPSGAPAPIQTSQVAAPAANQGPNADPAFTRTGAQGHPSSMANLVAPELARRAAAGETLSTMKDETVALSKWLANEQPQAKPRAIENALRDTLRTVVNAAKERGI